MFADYVMAYPSGSVVALVTAPVAAADRAGVASEIFNNEPSCEQLGFVEFLDENSISLEMMDGELGGVAEGAAGSLGTSAAGRVEGRALASAAAYLADAYNMPVYEDMYVNVYGPGAEQPVQVQVLRKKDSAAEITGSAQSDTAEQQNSAARFAAERHNFTCYGALPLSDGSSDKIKIEVVI